MEKRFSIIAHRNHREKDCLKWISLSQSSIVIQKMRMNLKSRVHLDCRQCEHLDQLRYSLVRVAQNLIYLHKKDKINFGASKSKVIMKAVIVS